MAISPTFLRTIRLAHRYLGIFIAPALLFFAFTGALQTFNLHETTKGSSYKPPAWVATLSQIHKKQTPIVPVKKASVASQAGPPAPGAPTVAATHNPLPLKIFFLLVSVGLFVSTVTGISMSYKFIRDKVVITALLIAGIIIPVAMILV